MDGLAIGRTVHYVPPTHSTIKRERPMIIVEVVEDTGVIDAVLFTNIHVDQTPGNTLNVRNCPHSEGREPGTWHFPERV